MKYFVILYALIALSSISQAQMLTVRDNSSGRALEQALVRTGNATAITKADGRADISAMKGAALIRVEVIGYAAVELAYDRIEAQGFVVHLEQTPFRMDEVIVSATRWKQPQRDIPSRTVTIREDDIHVSNPQTAADMLAASGEVYIQKSQLGGGSPMIRGFATNRVLLVVDGVRMNTAIFRTGNVQNVISLDPLATERTEVLFGPGSVMYGSDAIGGVMSFSTLSPRIGGDGRSVFSGSAVVRGSSANAEKTAHVDFRISLPKWGFVTSASWSDFDDLVMGSNGPDEFLRPRFVERINGFDSIVTNADPEKQVSSGYSQVNLMQKIRFQPDASWDISYGLHYSSTSDFNRYDRLTRPRGNNLRSAEWYYGPQIWTMNALSVAHSSQGGFYDDANMTVAYQFFKESRHDRDYRKPTRFNRTETVDAFSTNLDFAKSLAKDHHLTYGAEALINTVGSTGDDENIVTGVSVPGATRYPDGATWKAFAAYANYRYAAASDLSLLAGMRYSNVSLDATFDTTFFPFPFTTASMRNGALNGSLGMVYTPIPAMTVHAVLSTGFRSPNVDDVGKVFDSTPGAVVVPNPTLTPEYAYNAELGFSQVFGTDAKIDITAFYTLLQDALVRRDYTLDGRDSIMYNGVLSRVQAIQNAAEAHVKGVQARIELRIIDGIGLTSQVTAMSGNEVLDDGSTGALRHVSPWYGVTHLTYTGPRFSADVYSVYNGKIEAEDLAPALEGKDYLYAFDENGKAYCPAWYTLNLKVRYMLTDYVHLTAGVENITDQRYRPFASGITAPGRNFIGSIRAMF